MGTMKKHRKSAIDVGGKIIYSPCRYVSGKTQFSSLQYGNISRGAFFRVHPNKIEKLRADRSHDSKQR